MLISYSTNSTATYALLRTSMPLIVTADAVTFLKFQLSMTASSTRLSDPIAGLRPLCYFLLISSASGSLSERMQLSFGTRSDTRRNLCPRLDQPEA